MQIDSLKIIVKLELMKNLIEYIESGIIESYVMGLTTEEETNQIEALAIKHIEIADAIEEYSKELEKICISTGETPDPITKPFVMASYDYMSRLEHGELPSEPPILSPSSTIADYNKWILRPDLSINEIKEEVFAKIIGFTPTAITAIVWLQDMAPQEIHHAEYERFLIIEGTCDIKIGEDIHSLSPGDFLEIPLHVTHSVKVTSLVPCKVLLQRVAA